MVNDYIRELNRKEALEIKKVRDELQLEGKKILYKRMLKENINIESIARVLRLSDEDLEKLENSVE